MSNCPYGNDDCPKCATAQAHPVQSERQKLIKELQNSLPDAAGSTGAFKIQNSFNVVELADYILQREQEARANVAGIARRSFIANLQLSIVPFYTNLLKRETAEIGHAEYSKEYDEILDRFAASFDKDVTALTPKSITPCMDIHCKQVDHVHAWDSSLPKSTEPKEGRPIRLPEVAMQAFDSDPKGQQFLDVCSDFRSYMFKQDAGDMWKLIYYSRCIPLIADFVVKRETSATPQDSTAKDGSQCLGAHCKCLRNDCPNYHHGDHVCPFESSKEHL